jgi:SAM-dependent methyltransferase
MAGVEQNLDVWNRWDWSQAGEEWSNWWGGTDAMWAGALLPRIHRFVPAGTILEIAPGYGRWTAYLKDLCERLVLVDLTEACIEHCRNRFAESRHVEYHVNDGRSLAMIPDESVDFAFSFDSLVHADASVMSAYLGQLASKLTEGGVGFLHHSNLGGYPRAVALTKRMPRALLTRLIRHGLAIDLPAWRAEDVSAGFVVDCCARSGLACIAQEKISWENGRFLTDAITVVTRADGSRVRELEVAATPTFGQDGRRMARLYARV